MELYDGSIASKRELRKKYWKGLAVGFVAGLVLLFIVSAIVVKAGKARQGEVDMADTADVTYSGACVVPTSITFDDGLTDDDIEKAIEEAADVADGQGLDSEPDPDLVEGTCWEADDFTWDNYYITASEGEEVYLYLNKGTSVKHIELWGYGEDGQEDESVRLFPHLEDKIVTGQSYPGDAKPGPYESVVTPEQDEDDFDTGWRYIDADDWDIGYKTKTYEIKVYDTDFTFRVQVTEIEE